MATERRMKKKLFFCLLCFSLALKIKACSQGRAHRRLFLPSLSFSKTNKQNSHPFFFSLFRCHSVTFFFEICIMEKAAKSQKINRKITLRTSKKKALFCFV